MKSVHFLRLSPPFSACWHLLKLSTSGKVPKVAKQFCQKPQKKLEMDQGEILFRFQQNSSIKTSQNKKAFFRTSLLCTYNIGYSMLILGTPKSQIATDTLPLPLPLPLPIWLLMVSSNYFIIVRQLHPTVMHHLDHRLSSTKRTISN